MTQHRSRAADVDDVVRAMLDAVDAVCFAVDGDGELVAWNDVLQERLGYSDGQVQSLTLADVVARGSRERIPTAAAIEEDGADEPMAVDLVTSAGETVTHAVDWSVHVDGTTDRRVRIGVARDEPDRHELEHQRALLQGLLNAIPDVVYAFDETGEPVAEEFFLEEFAGYSGEELAALNPLELIAPADRSRMEETIGSVLADGGIASEEATLLTKDGERIPHEFRATRFELDDEVLGVVGTGRDISERVERERELEHQRALHESLVTAVPDVVFAFDETGDPLAEEFLLKEFAGYGREELRETHPSEVIAPEARGELASAIEAVLADGGVVSREAPLLTKDGERVPYEFRATRFEFEDEVLGFVGSARDVGERVERERALERQRDELAAIADISELILEITHELLETPSRRDVERIVCERLAGTDRYEFAWIGEPAVDGDRLVPRVTAGEDDGYVDEAAVGTGDAVVGPGPGGRAWQTGEVQVSTVEAEDVAPWQEAAAARGVEAVAAIPLRHAETVYGVLGVYATSPDAFTDRKVDAFQVLGETVGFVINAIKRRRLLFAEAVVDLEITFDESSTVLARLATALDCEVRLEGYLELDGRWVGYLDVEGAADDAVLDILADDTAVERARTIDQRAADTRVEVEVRDSPLFDAADAVGATVRETTASPGDARAVLEVSDDEDVRETVDLLTEALPEVSLLAKQERDRRPSGPGTPDGLLERLTERQREALIVAYRAGYFDWPRESTAEEVARTFDISRATLHAHLRKAQRDVLASLVD